MLNYVFSVKHKFQCLDLQKHRERLESCVCDSRIFRILIFFFSPVPPLLLLSVGTNSMCHVIHSCALECVSLQMWHYRRNQTIATARYMITMPCHCSLCLSVHTPPFLGLPSGWSQTLVGGGSCVRLLQLAAEGSFSSCHASTCPLL